MKLAKSMVIAAVALAVECGQGADGGGGKVDSAARQAEWTALETQKRQLDAKRGELATLRQQAAAAAAVAAAEAEAGLPCVDPVREGGERLLALLP